MKADYQKFANQRFLKTVDAELLHRFLLRHEIMPDDLDVGLLLRDPDGGRYALSQYLLGPVERCPESLTADLHRIAQVGRPIGMDLLIEEGRRQRVTLFNAGASQAPTPRNLALTTFIQHPDVFTAVEDALDFIQPDSVMEFVLPVEGIVATLDDKVLGRLEQVARTVFEADLRGGFCKIAKHDDGDEVHVSVRHGAHLQTREIVGQEAGSEIVSYREIDKVVLAYSEIDGRLKIWGGAKAHRSALADAFAELSLGKPGLLKTTDAQRLYTLGPAERGGASFAFRHGHDEAIESVRIYEAQVNRTAINQRSGAEKTVCSLIVRDTRGQALRLLHESRPDIAYNNGWKLNHLTIKIMLRTGGPRARALTVKIKPHETVSFQRYRHQSLVMDLLRLNGMVLNRDAGTSALAAE